MKKIALLSILTVLLFISCKKEEPAVNDEVLDEDFPVIDETADEVQDESADPDETAGEADEISDLDEEVDNETDEDVAVLNRLYVKAGADGKNNGLSWKDAFSDLQDAIDAAEEDYEIWVAKGTYKPSRIVHNFTPVTDPSDNDHDRFRHFALKDKVSIFGGFSGTETARDKRDWKINQTILSGDLDNSGDLSQGDAYHVLLNINISNDAVLDGFVITGGNADYSLQPGVDLHPNQGGGMNNRSMAHPTIRNCIFKGNSAQIGGGAMANLKSHPQIYDSVFEDNSSFRGGAINNSESSPYIQNTVFKNNNAEGGYGGAVFNKGKSRGSFVDCQFINNSSSDGGAVNNTVNSGITVSGSVFKENSAASGGAISNSQSDSFIIFSVFENNTAENGGGAIENFTDSSPKIVGSVFKNNSVTGIGEGGAILSNTGSPLVVSSLFYGNTAYSGGAVANTGSTGNFINNTFYDNKSTGQFGYGGAMFNQYGSNTEIINCIFYMNLSDYKGDQIFNNSSDPLIKFSLIQDSFPGDAWDNSLGINIQGNFSADPVFNNIAIDDFSIKSSSPCLDKGTNSPFETGGAALSYQEDILGNPRISNGKADAGAYEYQQ